MPAHSAIWVVMSMPARRSAPVSYTHLAQEVACRLKIPAQQNSIFISVQCSSAFVTGVPYILDEMLYNLADNAVKYNRPGGRVVISTGTEGGHAYMQVSDTGIGIPAADRERVFERFYRVDKSRSCLLYTSRCV